MGLQSKGEQGEYDKPSIPDDYYIARLLPSETPDEVELQNKRFDFAMPSYDRDECLGMVMLFQITKGEHTGVELPFFAPAKLSLARDRFEKENPSRLAANLQQLGVLETVLDHFDIKDAIQSGEERWMAETEDEYKQLVLCIRELLGDKDLRIHVEQDDEGNSQISKLDRIWTEDESLDEE